MILDGVVSTAGKHLGDLGPSISESNMTFYNDAIFFHGPVLGLVDIRIQVVVPTLATLLSTSSREMRCNGTPFFGPCEW